MIDIPDVPKTLHSERERGRLHAQGHRTDDTDSRCTLLVIHEADGSWAIHGLGAPGVRLTKDKMINLAEAILKAAR
ncbi:MAG: hypothetical protein ACRDRP_18560 [Pseudonocardiaceae bacterium]